MEPKALWSHLTFGDSGLPTGGFALSHSLETLVQDGQVTTLADLAGVLDAYARQLGTTELIGLWHVVRSSDPVRAAVRASRRLASLVMPEEVHETAAWQGKRLVAILDRLTGRSGTLDGPVYGGPAAGLIARRLGLPGEEFAAVYLYTQLNEMAQAFVRLVRVDSLEVYRVLWEGRVTGQAVIEDASHGHLSRMAAAAPLLEVAQMRHQEQVMRLFRT